MIPLFNYIFESGSTKEETAAQEILSCIFFDKYFNLNVNTDNIIDSVSKDIIDKIKSLSKISIDYSFIERVLNKDNDKKTKIWLNSFVYQIKSFENYLRKHPMVGPFKFVHHDSCICAFKDTLSIDDIIPERVNRAAKYLARREKDNYTKADIYVISKNHKENGHYLDTIGAEFNYWATNYENILGVSLKCLSGVCSDPKLIGVETQGNAISEINNMRLYLNPFGQSSKNLGNISSYIEFVLTSNGKSKGYSFNIRGKGYYNIRTGQVNDVYYPEKEINFNKCSASFAKEMKNRGIELEENFSLGQMGAVKAKLFKTIPLPKNELSKYGVILTAEEIEGKLNDLQRNLQRCEWLECNDFGRPTKEQIELTNKYRYKENLDSDKTSYTNTIKWSKCVEYEIAYLSKIFEHVQYNEEKMAALLLDLFNESSGIGENKLPYLYLA